MSELAEGARLESVYGGNPIVGSNPTRSAIFLSPTLISTSARSLIRYSPMGNFAPCRTAEQIQPNSHLNPAKTTGNKTLWRRDSKAFVRGDKRGKNKTARLGCSRAREGRSVHQVMAGKRMKYCSSLPRSLVPLTMTQKFAKSYAFSALNFEAILCDFPPNSGVNFTGR